MIYLFVLLIIGFLVGWLLRNKNNWIKTSEKILLYTIYLLLFTIGMSVGKNPKIIKNIFILGIDALVISFFCVLGSISIAFIVFKYILKK